MFYDVTTLYFETAQTDVLREPGFSKDGKTAESQVVLGLLVSEGGYPLSYSLFNGSQYEGFTMIPMIDDFKQRFTLGDDFVVVADSGLMNKNNVKLLQQAGYKYILGARIKTKAAMSSNGFSHWTKGTMSAMNSSGPTVNVLSSAIPKSGQRRMPTIVPEASHD